MGSQLDLLTPEIVSLHDYWRSKAEADRPPARRDIDPMELAPALLPHIGLIDVVRDGGALRFRYRLIGTAMVDLFGEDFTGTFADESKTGAYGAYLHDLYSQAVLGPAAVASVARFGFRGSNRRVDRSFLRMERLILPLCVGEDVGMLLFSSVVMPAALEDGRGAPAFRQASLLGFDETCRRVAPLVAEAGRVA
ncbi:MAG: hypothetical protein TEF_06770 [Rhizobiales bacterium NRL2]|jgi:hypothetical protein|nr:MAG: hypothetical protein TEF_06770 [Rhizobiales bacterium NRL2]